MRDERGALDAHVWRQLLEHMHHRIKRVQRGHAHLLGAAGLGRANARSAQHFAGDAAAFRRHKRHEDMVLEECGRLGVEGGGRHRAHESCQEAQRGESVFWFCAEGERVRPQIAHKLVPGFEVAFSADVLEYLKIKTRLTNEKFESVKGECAI